MSNGDPPGRDDPAPDPSRATLDTLEERVRSLEAENAHLRRVERTLRASVAATLHEGEARFRLLIESVKDYAIFMLDPDGRVATWNVGAERIKGYRAEEIIGRHFSTFYPPEDVAGGKCERELVAAVAEGRFEDEGWRVRKDGTRFWANVVITPLRDPSGNVLGFAKVTRDLTERVRAEDERVQMARMEEADRRKDDFLAIMGHELRNPLAPLVTAAHMIRLRGGRATEKEMGVLDRQLRQMTKIVRDLLDASRAMRENVELSLAPMEIGEVLANAIELASPFIEEGQHQLVVDVPARGLVVNVDPDRMAQVFGNVLHNAAKYTRRRAGRSGSERRTGGTKVGRSSSRTTDRASHPRRSDGIFGLFAQGEQGLERVDRRRARDRARGRPEARCASTTGGSSRRAPGSGRASRFTILLPRAQVRPRAISVVVAPGPAPVARPKRILIADDNRDSADMMQTTCSRTAGTRSASRTTAQDAVAVCEDLRPDIVFTDIGLPGMDGYEVAKRIRALPGCDPDPDRRGDRLRPPDGSPSLR